MTAIDRLSGLAQDVSIKAPCRVATTANITLNGLQTIDGVALAADDRVLVWNQTNAVNNGIYVADTSDWSRDVDFNGAGDCAKGTIVVVTSGTLYTQTVFQLTTTTPVIDTSTLAFAVMGASALQLASAFMLTVLDDTTAAAARATLGALNIAGDTLTGVLNEKHGADIASATGGGTLNLTTATGNVVDVTGTTTQTAITLGDGMERHVRFTGILTLTHGASLVLPNGGSNITTAAGDYAIFRGYASGVVRCEFYQRLAGTALVAAAATNTKSGIVNAGCVVAQGVTVNLSTSRQLAKVDGFAAWASAGAVSAGTIAQDASSSAGRTGYALKLDGTTLTGSAELSVSCRLESLLAKRYKNATISFAVLVYHDIGSAKDFTVTVNKADAADNFSAVTAIGTSGATSVSDATATLVKYEGLAVGDCSNGLEIIVKGATGAITTKNISFTEWQLVEASTAPAFFYEEVYAETLAKCQRYFFSTFPRGTAPAQAAGATGSFQWGNINTGAGQYTPILPLPVSMRAVPTVTTYNPVTANALAYDYTGSQDWVAITSVTAGLNSMTILGSPVNGGIGRQISIHLIADARL